MILPSGMDGVGGLSQPHIPVGKTFVYEFDLVKIGHLHVPPAFGRDGADGDGHDGLFRDPPEGPGIHARGPRLRVPHQCLRHRPRLLCAEDHDHDRLQSVVMEQQGVSGHRPAGGFQGRPRACACRQSDHDKPPDPYARLRFRGDLHGWRLGAARGAVAGGEHRHPRGCDARL
ncbi:hypothetical protein L1887_57663 [Cichorium endivia]|nr:hypothetical protein L1887_57663 [Cichorium endivia]